MLVVVILVCFYFLYPHQSAVDCTFGALTLVPAAILCCSGVTVATGGFTLLSGVVGAAGNADDDDVVVITIFSIPSLVVGGEFFIFDSVDEPGRLGASGVGLLPCQQPLQRG